MPVLERGDARIRWWETGSGFPVLLFAPGGMRSTADKWGASPFDPRDALSGSFRVISMDQRNAGASVAPVTADDGWHTYAEDHLALLDHLGIEQCHVMGGCIGSSYCLGLLRAAPERITAAVLQNPIGRHENRELFFGMFDSWAEPLLAERDDVDPGAMPPFRERMYGGDFTFNVDRDFVAGIEHPLLILAGDDDYHPRPIAEEIASLAPNNRMILDWKAGEAATAAAAAVREFLEGHSAVGGAS